MAHVWPHPGEFKDLRFEVLDQECWDCKGPTSVRDYRRRPVHTLEGPVRVIKQVRQCLDESCDGHGILMTAEEEMLIAPPLWILAWDAFARLGQARFARHLSVPEIREELADDYGIHLSEDCIEDYIGRYQAMLAARQGQAGLEPEAAYLRLLARARPRRGVDAERYARRTIERALSHLARLAHTNGDGA